MSPLASSAWLKAAAALSVVLLLGVANWLGPFARLSEPAKLEREFVALGAWGYVAFVVAYALSNPFGVPGTVFVLAAPLVWPWPVAFAVSMVGTMMASVIGFGFARFVGRDWLSPRIPARLRKYEERLNERAFSTVAALRFVFWMAPLLHAFLGISRVRASTHFWASLVGYIVPLFVLSYFGARVFAARHAVPLSFWIVGVSVAALAAAVMVVLRARKRCMPAS